MPNSYTPMGGVPDFYSSLLNNAQQNLVRMPDGTLQQAPQYGQPTNLNDIYGGILPPNGGGLTSRSVNTVPIDPRTGNPMMGGTGFNADSMGQSMAEQSGMRRSYTQGVQPGGTVPMPAGVRPAGVDSLFAQMGPQAQQGMYGRGLPRPPTQVASATPFPRNRPFFGGQQDPFGTNGQPKYIDRLPSDMGYLTGPNDNNPALNAIDRLTGSGNSVRPRPNPFGYAAPQSMNLAPVPRARPPSLQAVQAASRPAQTAADGSITIKKGDTVWALAQQRGMTVDQFARAYGIADPNRIRAGATLSPAIGPKATTTPFPRRPQSAYMTSPSYVDTPVFNPRNEGPWDRLPTTQEKPAGYGSKGYSEAGLMLRELYGN